MPNNKKNLHISVQVQETDRLCLKAGDKICIMGKPTLASKFLLPTFYCYISGYIYVENAKDIFIWEN